MGCGITRRELFTALVGAGILFLFPEGVFAEEEKTKAEVPLLPMKCFSCSIGVCFCGRPPRPALKVSYWFPVGFLEANRECEFLAHMVPIVGSLVQAPLREFCRTVPVVLPTGQVKTGPVGVGQDYMRFHARWYSLPKPLHSWVRDVVLTVKLCPCIGLNAIFEKVLDIPVVSEGLKVYQSIMGRVAEVERTAKESVRRAVEPVVERVKSFIPSGPGGSADFSRAKNVLNRMNEFRQWIPLVITEPFSPLWLVDLLSVDNATAAAIANAIQTLISTASPPLGALACPFLTQELVKRNLLPREIRGLDTEFICVGYWGRGYPRIGVVRHDDPYIARLLALARFHHLFSKTFPLIPVPIDMDPDRMKYQIWSPFVSDCFGIGRWGVPTLDDIKDLTDTGKLVERLEAIGWDTIKSVMRRAVEEKRGRKMMVIVWKKEERCCC
jgi:hypothetical protein